MKDMREREAESKQRITKLQENALKDQNEITDLKSEIELRSVLSSLSFHEQGSKSEFMLVLLFRARRSLQSSGSSSLKSMEELRKKCAVLQSEAERVKSQCVAHESLISNLQTTLAALEREKVCLEISSPQVGSCFIDSLFSLFRKCSQSKSKKLEGIKEWPMPASKPRT